MIWFAIPCKRTPSEANRSLSKWREQGYAIALWQDPDDPLIESDLTLVGEYPGYHRAVNCLCREILKSDPTADWIVTGGDDMDPDPNKRADEIAAECTEHFAGTFGVMQPIGDDFAGTAKINGSPWMGREFCRRMYGGIGPWFEGYPHMWGDQEQYEVTKSRGILWQRKDLSHYHHHQSREGGPILLWMQRNNLYHPLYRPLFEERLREGFPGHEPID